MQLETTSNYMDILNLILFGSIVGVLSTVLFKGARTGLLGAMLLGSVGAISGSFIANMLFESGTETITKITVLFLTLASSLALVSLRRSIYTR